MSSTVREGNQVCEYCNSKTMIQSRGEIICGLCGTVIDRVYTQSTHSMVENSYEGPTQYTSIGKRLGQVGGLGSEIGYFNSRIKSSPFGRGITPEIAMKYNRLNSKFHKPSKNTSTQTHLRTFSIFNRVASHLQLTNSLKERTSYLYWKYVNDKKNKISNHVLLIALCLLYAVRENREKSPYTFKEIISAFEKGGHRVTNRNILQLATDLEINLNRRNVRRSEDYILRITEQITSNKQIVNNLINYGELGIGEYQVLLNKISSHLLSTLSAKERGGVQPFGFAASIVYLADRGVARYFKKTPLLTQSLTAQITGAKEYTIRDHCYKNLSKHFECQKKALYSIIKSHLN